MATGFAPALLKSIALVAKDNTPQYKLEPAGFLNLLKSQDSPKIVSNGLSSGQKRTVIIKKKQRAIVADTDTTASCDQTLTPAYTEDTVPLDIFRQISLYYDDETIAKYTEEAAVIKSLGGVSVTAELIDSIMTHASAILQGLDQDLLTKHVATFGVNRVTGLSTTTALNFALNTTNLPLASGMNQVLSEYKINGGVGRPQIIGSGLFYNYMTMQIAKGLDQSGLDTKIQAAGVDFYHDLNATTIYGANQIGVIQPNAVQLVEYMKYVGYKAGNKGVSTFFTMSLPMQVGADIIPVDFDVQVKYIDCPTTLTDAYSGATITTDKGYQVIISKTCGLYSIPTTAYKAGDPLSGNTGSLRYTVSNT